MSKRSLPLWMTGQSKSSALLGGTGDDGRISDVQSTDKAISQLCPSINAAADLASNEPTKRRLRSNYKFETEQKAPDLKIEYLPFVEYNGTIEYHTAMQDIAFSCDLLLQWVQKQPPDVSGIPIAFDLEWAFNFKSGPGRTALMQLCADTKRCVLLQLSCLKRLPAAVLELLYHPRVILHGVNIKNDFRKLARDFPGLDADRLIAQCCDLGQWYNRLHGTTGIWSMERLVQVVLKQRVNKDKRVRMSKWDVLPLSDDQKLYAAIDVYISQELYLKLAEKQLVTLGEDVRCEQQVVKSPTAASEAPHAEREAAEIAYRTTGNSGRNIAVGGLPCDERDPGEQQCY